MQYRDKLIAGLKEIEHMLLARVEADNDESEAFLVAAGFLCGYIQHQIPELVAIPDVFMEEFDKVSTEFLDGRASAREEKADE